MRLLLVEDHKDLADSAVKTLRAGGFQVDAVDCLSDASLAAGSADYDALLLDRQLPDGDGLDWLAAHRRSGARTPAIVMTAARTDVADRIAGLNEGADDYLVKPVDYGELVARVRAVLRRPQSLVESTVTVGNLALDTTARTISIAGAPLGLPRRELCLLECLVRRFGRAVQRATIEETLYGFNEEVTPNAIEVSVHRLRVALKASGASVTIHTVRGIGYMLIEAKGDAARRA